MFDANHTANPCICQADVEAANTKLIDAAGATDATVAKITGQVEGNTKALRIVEEELDDTVKDIGVISKANEDTATCLASRTATHSATPYHIITYV